MTRFEAWSLHVSNALVGGTGAIYAWMLYAAESDDPYAIVNHPQQPLLQHLHVWFAPLLVFAVGLVWQAHVSVRVRAGFRPRRTTGLGLALLFVPMAASGYLLQTATQDAWRQAWIIVHVATSVLWIAGYLVHLVSKRPAASTLPTSRDLPRRARGAARQTALSVAGPRVARAGTASRPG